MLKVTTEYSMLRFDSDLRFVIIFSAMEKLKTFELREP